MRTITAIFFLCVCAFGQNYAVKHAKDLQQKDGLPDYWPIQIQPIGDMTHLPSQFQPPWTFATQAQLNEWLTTNAAAKELWNQVIGTRETRKQRVGQVLQERIEAGQWEPKRLRLHALESELFGKLMQAFRLNSELLLLVTKAVGQSALTNNLTAGERSRVATLRPQIVFAQAPDLTQADRDRVIYVTSELAKIESLWKQARDLRNNIETNTSPVDPESLSTITIGE